MNQKQQRTLIEAAKRTRRKAYAPYSRFFIGASVLTGSGRVYAGANVENASYGLTICAERVAIANAVTHGEKDLRAICIVGRSPRPCGACRQVMVEFSTKDTEVITVDLGLDGRRDTVTRTLMPKLLPNAFDPLDAGLLPANPQNLIKRRKSQSSAAKKRRKRTPAKKAAPKKKRPNPQRAAKSRRR